jgi:hypothetical protein
MGIGTDTQESLAHHLVALRIINSQMCDVRLATSDGVISAIAGFSCYYVGARCFAGALGTGSSNHST